MIGMADILRDMNGVGFINLTTPSKMEMSEQIHHRATAPFSEVEEARRLHKRGVSDKEISARLGRSTNTIRGWIQNRTRISA